MKDCLLCGGPPAYLGSFVITEDAERYVPIKLAPGKTRAVWYLLCNNCFDLPDKAERVEGVLEAAATQARN